MTNRDRVLILGVHVSVVWKRLRTVSSNLVLDSLSEFLDIPAAFTVN